MIMQCFSVAIADKKILQSPNSVIQNQIYIQMSMAAPNNTHELSHNQNEVPKESIQSINNGQNTQIDAHRLPPDLPRIYVDNADTKNIVCFWCIFAIMIVIMIIIAIFIPDGIIILTNQNQLMETKYKQCSNTLGFYGGDLQCKKNHDYNVQDPTQGLVALNVRYSNLFLLISMNLYPKDVGKQISSSQKINLEFQPVTLNNNGDIKALGSLQKQEIQWTFNSNQAKKIYGLDDSTLLGYQTIIKYYPDIKASPGYLITAKFSKPGELADISTIYFYSYSADIEYTTFSIAIRLVCLGITLLTGCAYIWKFCQIPSGHRIIQQKIILALTVAVWFFNDCLYAVTLYYPNGFMTFWSTTVIVNFFVLILFSWVYFLRRIRLQNGIKQTELTPRNIWLTIILFILVYVVFLITCIIFSFYSLEKAPIMPTEHIQPEGAFWILKFVCFAALAIVYCCLAYQYVSCLCNFTQKLWRNKIFLIFYLFFAIIILLCALYYGYYIESFNGAKTLFVYISASLYVIYLQYMYSIPGDQIENLQRQGSVKQIRSQVASALDQFTYGVAQVHLPNYAAGNGKHQTGNQQKLLQKEQIEQQGWKNSEIETEKKDEIQMHPIQLQDEAQKSQNFDDFHLQD